MTRITRTGGQWGYGLKYYQGVIFEVIAQFIFEWLTEALAKVIAVVVEPFKRWKRNRWRRTGKYGR